MKTLNLTLIALLSIACISLNAQTSSVKVTAVGNVGIGTDTPDAKLDVKGDTKTEGAIIKKQNGSASVSFEKVGKSAFTIGSGTHGGFTVDRNYHLEFRSNTRDRVLGRYISEGNLLMRFEKITGDVGFGGITNPTTSIHTSGSITYNGALFNASDQRLKKNMVDMNYGLKEVLQLNPISYQYNGKGGIKNVDRKQFGLKAQELQKVAPELVSTFTHQIEDAETKVIDTEEYLMIEESGIKYLLMNAIQEQQAIIEDQAKKIEQQDKRMSAMETELAAIKALLTDESSKNTLGQNIQIDGSNLSKAQLGQNAPNPFNENTNVEYYIPESSINASVAIYDITGKMIKEVGIKNTGKGQLNLQLNNLPSGQYHYSLIVDGKIQDSKTMILK